MFIRKPRKSRPALFVSAKTAAPVPARHPALRTCLVQASLDPQVRAIGHVASAHVASVPVALDVIVLTRDDGHLDVVPARRVRDLEEEEGLQRLQRRADETVSRHRAAVVAIAESLRARRYLNGKAVRAIFAAHASAGTPRS